MVSVAGRAYNGSIESYNSLGVRIGVVRVVIAVVGVAVAVAVAVEIADQRHRGRSTTWRRFAKRCRESTGSEVEAHGTLPRRSKQFQNENAHRIVAGAVSKHQNMVEFTTNSASLLGRHGTVRTRV